MSSAYDTEKAYSSLKAAFDFYIETGDVERAVFIAEDRAFSGGPGGGMHHQVRAYALSLVAPDSLAEGRLLCHYAGDIYHETADYEGAKQSFDRAATIAQREADAALEARTLSAAAHVDTDEFRWKDGLEKGLQAIALSTQGEDPESENWARRAAFEALCALGDFEGASGHAEATPAWTVGLPQRHRAAAVQVKMSAAYRRADWQAARAICDQGLEKNSSSPQLLGLRAQLEHELGEPVLGSSYLDQLIEFMHRANPGPTQPFAITAMVIAEISRITGSTERFKDVERAAEVVLSSPRAIPRFAFCARTGLAMMAVQRGDAPAAAEQYAALNRVRDTFVLPFDLSSVPRRLGLLAQTMGNPDQAAAHFEDGLVLCRKTDYRSELAWTCCDYADLLIVGARHAVPLPGGPEKALLLLEEALSISTELGMKPLTERVTTRLAAIETPPAPPAAYPDGLTQREIEVLRLIALGKNNREIGEELVISLRTVAHHVTSILTKSSSANRTEAAAYATRQGLVSL